MEVNIKAKKIIYRNNDWVCLVARNLDADKTIRITGNINPVEGVSYIATGTYNDHPKYGITFVASYLEPSKPTDLEGIKGYLTSGFIKGIGPKTAKKIVDKFKHNTLNVLENEPERLLEIKGVSKRLLKKITDSYNVSNKYKNLSRLLMPFGITANEIRKIVDKYKERAYEKTTENPYKLMEDIKGFGFKKVDEIAIKLGFSKTCPERMRAAILYFLNYDCEKEGNTYVLKVTLTKKINKLLGEPVDYKKELDNLIQENQAVIEDNKVYGINLYNAERYVAARLNRYRENKNKDYKNLIDKVSNILKKENSQFIGFNDEQKEAIKNACNCNLSVITGGPGTGKTFTLKGILKTLELLEPKKNILLMAPTGKAAKRMTEQTGRDAYTIHKVIKQAQNDYCNDFDKIDTVIVDESSMINIILMANLLGLLDNNCRLIFIGDVDQLPCIGPGTALKDMIANFPTTYLRKIYRQDNASGIVINASRIKLGDDEILLDKTFKIKEYDENKDIEAEVLRQYDKYKNMYGSKEVIVLCPYRSKSDICVDKLNEAISGHSSYVFKENDRVIHTTNDYNLEYYIDRDSDYPEGSGVFNGETGTVIEIDDETGEITVEFDDGRVVYYDIKTARDELSLCYAMTIHKSQGSEYKIVIMPIIKSHAFMLKRNLLYTGITRAKEKCIIIGQKEAYDLAVKMNDVEHRKSSLNDLLKEGTI